MVSAAKKGAGTMANASRDNKVLRMSTPISLKVSSFVEESASAFLSAFLGFSSGNRATFLNGAELPEKGSSRRKFFLNFPSLHPLRHASVRQSVDTIDG